jgi:hypothetical protein
VVLGMRMKGSYLCFKNSLKESYMETESQLIKHYCHGPGNAIIIAWMNSSKVRINRKREVPLEIIWQISNSPTKG